MTNFIDKVKDAYQAHRTLIIFTTILFLATTISFALGVVVGEELVSKTPLIYSKTDLSR